MRINGRYARRIGSRPRIAGGLVRQRRNLNTILNRHRLIRWAARILQQLRPEFPVAPATREAGVAHGSPVRHWVSRRAAGPAVGLIPAENQTLNQPCRRGLPASGSPPASVPSPAYVQLAVWCQVLGLHNKERARDRNPLISANSPRSSPPLSAMRFQLRNARGPNMGFRPGPVSLGCVHSSIARQPSRLSPLVSS